MPRKYNLSPEGRKKLVESAKLAREAYIEQARIAREHPPGQPMWVEMLRLRRQREALTKKANDIKQEKKDSTNDNGHE